MGWRSRRRSAALATSLLVGCGSPTQPTPQPPADSTRLEPRKDPAAELARGLAGDAVYHDKFARRILYSWTTTEQIDDLRKTKRLLVRDESPTNGASYVDQVLYALSLRGDLVAQKIYTAPFAKMRFAWPSMWATRAGWPNEQYGDQLIRITLKVDAWIAYLSTAGHRRARHAGQAGPGRRRDREARTDRRDLLRQRCERGARSWHSAPRCELPRVRDLQRIDDRVVRAGPPARRIDKASRSSIARRLGARRSSTTSRGEGLACTGGGCAQGYRGARARQLQPLRRRVGRPREAARYAEVLRRSRARRPPVRPARGAIRRVVRRTQLRPTRLPTSARP
jgi:hypothetical protein